MQRNRAWGFLGGFNAEKQLGQSWGALMQRNRAWGFVGGFNAEKQSLGILWGL